VLDAAWDLARETDPDAVIGTDPCIPGCVIEGFLQGDPMDPDVARISITIHENDPDNYDGNAWNDEPNDDGYDGLEIGGAKTVRRRFTLKARCLLENSREGRIAARQIASKVRLKIERCLLKTSFAGINIDNEYVSLGVQSHEITGKMLQSGGPPDSYDYHIEIKFQVLTTWTGV
jgi:hypothetical protein